MNHSKLIKINSTPNGKLLICADISGIIIIKDAITGEDIRSIRFNDFGDLDLFEIKISHDSSKIIT